MKRREAVATKLTDQLCVLAREAGAADGASGGSAGPAAGGPAVLADRPDGTVVGLGAVVAKAHPPAAGDQGDHGHQGDHGDERPADAEQLTVRLGIAAHPRLAGILLPPLAAATSGVPRPRRLPGGRLATLWPRGTPVSPDAPDDAPWEAAGVLLARLHAVPVEDLAGELPGAVPVMRGPAKAARAMRRLRAARGGGSGGATDTTASGLAPALAEAAEAVEGAWALLPAWCRAEESPPAARAGILCHGDFHLGQLVSHPPSEGSWQLIDVDDLGVGDPAWDLARPAAWYAAGLLPSADWERFLGAYQHAAGAPCRDPWQHLDAPARALTTQTAALAVVKAHAARRPLDEAEAACVEACVRMADVDRTSTTCTTATGGRCANA
ncbi:phosphotransferase [Streptomyces ovatisporus]|uniref:Phosphotransferase n=1 Tax=Streptomyces ovatisporus TaxID=1128682 RepID=A0ABV9A924_9ACTN